MRFQLAITILSLVAMAVPGIEMAQETADHATQTATGCLRRATTKNIYILTDENGKLWDLRSDTVPLRSQVGHTVTVTGTMQPDSKDSSDNAPQNHMLVTKLEMVRDSCKQP